MLLADTSGPVALVYGSDIVLRIALNSNWLLFPAAIELCWSRPLNRHIQGNVRASRDATCYVASTWRRYYSSSFSEAVKLSLIYKRRWLFRQGKALVQSPRHKAIIPRVPGDRFTPVSLSHWPGFIMPVRAPLAMLSPWPLCCSLTRELTYSVYR